MKIQYHSMFFLHFLLTPTLCIVYAGSRRDSLEISKSERVERLLLPPAVQVRCGKWVCARGALHREWTRLHSSRVEAVLSGVGRWRPDYQLNFAPTTCCFPYTMFFPHNGRFEQNFSNFLPLLPFPSPIKEYIGFVLSLSLLRKHFM